MPASCEAKSVVSSAASPISAAEFNARLVPAGSSTRRCSFGIPYVTFRCRFLRQCRNDLHAVPSQSRRTARSASRADEDAFILVVEILGEAIDADPEAGERRFTQLLGQRKQPGFLLGDMRLDGRAQHVDCSW